MNPQQRPWTAADLTALRHLYPEKGAGETARILGRSKQATYVRANQLGLSAPPVGIVWTPQMLKLLNDHYATMFNRDLTKLVGVSMRSLIRKARELGLEKTPDFQEVKRKEIGRRAGLAKIGKTSPALFRKGEHRNPGGEFKPGRVESAETKAKRAASLREYHRRRKLLERLGLRAPIKGQKRAGKQGAEGATIPATTVQQG